MSLLWFFELTEGLEDFFLLSLHLAVFHCVFVQKGFSLFELDPSVMLLTHLTGIHEYFSQCILSPLCIEIKGLCTFTSKAAVSNLYHSYHLLIWVGGWGTCISIEYSQQVSVKFLQKNGKKFWLPGIQFLKNCAQVEIIIECTLQNQSII